MATPTLKIAIRSVYRKILGLFPYPWPILLNYTRAHLRPPNLRNPQTFSEKIIWRKLYDRDPRFSDLSDKIKVKEIIGERFGTQFITPTLQVYNSPEELDFTKPPLSNPPYVIKVNHSVEMNIFARPGDPPLDPARTKKKLAKYLKYNLATAAGEWAYSKIQPRILVEPLMHDNGGYPIDYKFHVYDGLTYAIQVILDRHSDIKCSVYDRDWKVMDVMYEYPRCNRELPRPPQLQRMIELAEAIGKEFNYIRVDLYALDNGGITFGELTFYPASGYGNFRPYIWDRKFGEPWKRLASSPRNIVQDSVTHTFQISRRPLSGLAGAINALRVLWPSKTRRS